MPHKRRDKRQEKESEGITNNRTRSEKIYDVLCFVLAESVLPPLIGIIHLYTIAPTRWAFLVNNSSLSQSLRFYDPYSNQTSKAQLLLNCNLYTSFVKFSNVTGKLYHVRIVYGGTCCQISTIDENGAMKLICENYPYNSPCSQIWTPCAVYSKHTRFDLVSETVHYHDILDSINGITSSLSVGNRSFIVFDWHETNGARCLYYNGRESADIQRLPMLNRCRFTGVNISLLVDNKIIICQRLGFELVFWSLSFTKQSNGDLVFTQEWKHITETTCAHIVDGYQDKGFICTRLDQQRLLFNLYTNQCTKWHILDIQSGDAIWTAIQGMLWKPSEIIACQFETNAAFN